MGSIGRKGLTVFEGLTVMESFWSKKFESMVELKFDPGFWVIWEYFSENDSILKVKLTIWLAISSKLDSNIL